MRSITVDWLRKADAELKAAEELLADSGLSGQVVFHSAQCIENCFRAIAEYKKVELPATYRLVQLARLVTQYHLDIDVDLIRDLANFADGQVPEGGPTPEVAARGLNYAEKVLRISVDFCKDENDWDSSTWNTMPFF